VYALVCSVSTCWCVHGVYNGACLLNTPLVVIARRPATPRRISIAWYASWYAWCSILVFCVSIPGECCTVSTCWCVCLQCLYLARIGAFWCVPCECLHRVLIAGNRAVLLRWLAYRHEKTRVVFPGFTVGGGGFYG
jgi:hypothetical protein